jgi:hypothetical protein
MAAELFARGYKAWCSQRPDVYEAVGYIDGYEIHFTSDTPDAGERQFRHIAQHGSVS